MMRVYSVNSDGATNSLSQVYCKNEDKELQTLLDRNPDLLCGEQIQPDDPRRWLLIEREMPVPDPATGQDRWNIDFLFSDQDAMPTFVEVKRFGDTRARREVVGQMLEYAANGHHYWSKDQLRDYAEKTAERMGTTLEDAITELEPTDAGTVDAYFEQLQDNLREGQLRLVFFLEQASMELRSLVEFLNRQMERSEVLLIEARLFEQNGQRFVVPSLFGYSEEARRVKRVSTVSSGVRQSKNWSEDSFFAVLSEQTDEATTVAVRKFYEFAKDHQIFVRWGKGAQTGTFGLVMQSVGTSSILTIDTNGRLGLPYGWMHGDLRKEQFRDRMHGLMVESVGLPLGTLEEYEKKFPNFAPESWTHKVDDLIESYGVLYSEFGKG